jgi:hypothetical protein
MKLTLVWYLQAGHDYPLGLEYMYTELYRGSPDERSATYNRELAHGGGE